MRRINIQVDEVTHSILLAAKGKVSAEQGRVPNFNEIIQKAVQNTYGQDRTNQRANGDWSA